MTLEDFARAHEFSVLDYHAHAIGPAVEMPLGAVEFAHSYAPFLQLKGTVGPDGIWTWDGRTGLPRDRAGKPIARIAAREDFQRWKELRRTR
jgi:hypothetical protein